MNTTFARRLSLLVVAVALGACVQKKVTLPEEQTVAAATEPADAGADAEEAEEEDESPAKTDTAAKPKPACEVSFAKRVLPELDAAGCAGIQCHGTRLARAIRIEVEEPALTYASLTTFAIGGKPYVVPNAADRDASSIRCHLAGTCGVKMPPLGGKVPDELVKAVDAWLACGAPNN